MFHLQDSGGENVSVDNSQGKHIGNNLHMTRRNFIKGIGKILALSTAPKVFAVGDEINTTENSIDNLSESIDKYNRSKVAVGTIEIAIFARIFRISTDDSMLFPVAFTEKVKGLQGKYGLKDDGILGPKTLEALYRKEYSKISPENLSQETKDRLEAMNHADTYSDHPRYAGQRKLYPRGKPKVFKKSYYYGALKTVNKPGTYIDESLGGAFEETTTQKGVRAYMKKYKGKFVLGVYVDGELQVVSYASPGRNDIEGGIRTPRGKFWMKYWNKLKYRLTAAPTSVSNNGNRDVTDYMPNAVHIEGAGGGGVFIHAGYVDGERKSHGCVRIPYKYSLGLRKIMEHHKVGKIVVQQS